jgi:hypothetical protein
VRVGRERCAHGAIGAAVASHSVWIGMTTIDQEIAEGLGPTTTTLHLEDEALPAAVEGKPYLAIRGAKENRDGPRKPVNPDIVEAEATEKGEFLSRISNEFVFQHMGKRSTLTDPGGHKRPCHENRDDGDADYQEIEALAGQFSADDGYRG